MKFKRINVDMKLEIRRSKPKTPQKRVTVPIEADLLRAITAVINWRKGHTEYIGSIPLHEHLSVKIAEEILARSKAPNQCFVDYKISLPIDLVSRMKQSDFEYRKKGYVPEWENRIRKFLDILIRNYVNQLEVILGEKAPLELQSFCETRSQKSRRSKKDSADRNEFDALSVTSKNSTTALS